MNYEWNDPMGPPVHINCRCTVRPVALFPDTPDYGWERFMIKVLTEVDL